MRESLFYLKRKAGLSRDTVRYNVTINNLLPGSFDTDRLKQTLKAAADREGVSVEQAAQGRAVGIPAGRYGTPDEFGHACAFLCSAQSGYITGQNLLIDGGFFPGTM